MKKVLQKILLLIAVITVTTHNILPHIHPDDIMAFTEDHHHEQPADTHYHDDDNDNTKDNHHSLFSFAQLDENFILTNGHINNFELTVAYLPFLTAIHLSDNFQLNTKTHFGCYKEYPPPDDYFSITSLRGPPTV